jgi:hypothetical protein
MSKEIAEALNNIASALWGVADAITPRGAGHAPGTDATGGTVSSLTEAMMGVTEAIHSHDINSYVYSEAMDSIARDVETIAEAAKQMAHEEE